jgi:broad specificity phosphatase PhoE
MSITTAFSLTDYNRLMIRLTFVRHAQSIANAGGITVPHHDICLSDLGIRQAQSLAASLTIPASKIIVSSMRRTEQTAAPLCERLGIKPEVDSMLDEFSVIDPTLIAGLDGAQRKSFVKDYWAAPDTEKRLGPAADTFSEFHTRVQGFTNKMNSLPSDSIIFSHGIWLGLLFWILDGNEANSPETMITFRHYQQRLAMPNCAVFTLTQHAQTPWQVTRDTSLTQTLI